MDAADGEGSIRKLFGCAAVSADPTGALVVRSGPNDSEASGTMTLRADLVVGADGVNSAVRSANGFSCKVSTGSSYVRAVVPAPADPWFEEFWTPLGSFGHAPLGQGATYFWAAAHAPAVAGAVARRDLGSFADTWARVLPLAGALLAEVGSFDDLLVNTVRRVDTRRWHSGRVVLLGDAAHAMAPNLGQGANSALVDAVALADALSTTPSVPAALQRYDRRRRPTARRVQNTAGLLQVLCNLHRVPAIWTRDALLTRLPGLSRLSEWTTRRALASEIQAVRPTAVVQEPSPN